MDSDVEQRIPVPHDGPVLKSAKLVRLAVVHDHEHQETRRQAFVRQLDREEVRQLSRQARLGPPPQIWSSFHKQLLLVISVPRRSRSERLGAEIILLA